MVGAVLRREIDLRLVFHVQAFEGNDAEKFPLALPDLPLLQFHPGILRHRAGLGEPLPGNFYTTFTPFPLKPQKTMKTLTIAFALILTAFVAPVATAQTVTRISL